MLPVAGGIPPPGIVGNDRQQFCTLAHIPRAILTVNGFVAHSASDGDISIVKAGYLFLGDAAAHHSSQFIVQWNEDLRIGCEFRAHHELALVEDLRPAGSIGHDGGIMVLHPSVAVLAGKDGGFAALVEYLIGGCSEKKACAGMHR